MKNNFPKKQILFSTLFFIFSIALFFYFFKMTNKNKEISQMAEKEWQVESSNRDKMKTLNKTLRAIEKERMELETHFAQSSDIVPFLNTIDQLGPKVGVVVNVSSVDILKDSLGLLVAMKASGSFDGLYRFLILLENSPYEIEVISTDLKRETISDADDVTIQNPKWNANFRIKLLSFVK